MTANSIVRGRIWSNSEPIWDFMVVLVTRRNEELQSKMKALEWPKHYTSVYRTLMSSLFRSQWWDNLKFEHIPPFMHVLITRKNEEDPIKIKWLYKGHSISLTLSLWGFSRCSMIVNVAVRGRIWPNFELTRDFVRLCVVSVSCFGVRVSLCVCSLYF